MRIKLPYCNCDCKARVSKPGNKYIFGHQCRGKKQSKDHIENRKKARITYKVSDETKLKISNTLMGRKLSLETKQKQSEVKLGKKRSVRSKKWCQNLSKSLKGRKTWNKGKKATLRARQNQSKAHIGSKNHNWRGGKSFEPYGLEFNKELKAVIRKRDKNCCRLCGKRQYGRKHSVHHIDYNKQNNDPNNLITLCGSCHIKTNNNRDYWTEYFRDKSKKLRNKNIK